MFCFYLNQNICLALNTLFASIFLIFVPIPSVGSEEIVKELRMPGVTSATEDEYICTTWKPDSNIKLYISSFEALNDLQQSNAHHILLMGCSGQQDTRAYWDNCVDMCPDEQVIYAWARNADPLHLPPDVGFEVFGNSNIQYIKLQIHYLKIFSDPDITGVKVVLSTEPKPLLVGVLLMVSKSLHIPPHQSQAVGHVSCQMNDDVELHPFAFRTHTHSLGRVVSGYIKKGDQWIQIGKKNPQWPQAFYPVDSKVVIAKGDFLVSTCIYDSQNTDKEIQIGYTHLDEMCRLYIMYYRTPSSTLPPQYCKDDAFPDVASTVPPEAISSLPVNQLLEDVGNSHHHHHGHLSRPDAGDVYKIQMNNITTSKEDSYMCIDWVPPFSGKHFITGYEAIPDDPNVHHMLLFACSGKPSREGLGGTCSSDCKPSLIYFAWGRNAPSRNLPKNVSFEIGANGVDYLQLQTHYRTVVNKPDTTQILLTITDKPQPYTAGVMLLVANYLNIPSHQKRIIGNISCLYGGKSDLHPFAFRVHAHMLGQVISGYINHDSKWIKIGKGNPQWPQTFWPVTEKDLVIRTGDYLAAKCVYNSENYHVDVRIGQTHNDEMCNFYIMYYQLSSETRIINICNDDEFPAISDSMPPEALVPLPPNPDLDAMGEGLTSSHYHHQNMDGDINMTEKILLQPVANWPSLPSGFKFGQVSGVAVDALFVYVIHRSKTVWDDNSFDLHHIYQKASQGPIQENTLVKLNASTGVPLNFWGSNFFYMPHGLFVDRNGAYWVTDVAMHQVFKFSLSSIQDPGPLNPLITLGTKFIPGSDSTHFCKPADVASLLTGEVFVADGYCNSRIVAFDQSGSFVRSWDIGSSQETNLPHSISIDVTSNLVYVSERVNARILTYDTSGKFLKELKQKDFSPELFAISFSSTRNKLFCVNGDLGGGGTETMRVFRVMVVDPAQGQVLSEWNLPNLENRFSSPHDISISPDGNSVIVAILDTEGQVLKYDAASSMDFGLMHKSNKKGGVIYHRRPIGIGGKPIDDASLDDQSEESRKRLMTIIFIVSLCLLVLPLSVAVCTAIYLKNRQRNLRGYSHLEAAQQINRRLNGKKTGEIVKTFISGKGSLPDTIREEELKRLESESEEEFSAPNIRPGQI